MSFDSESEGELVKTFKECQLVIGYKPLPDEVDYLNFFLLKNIKQKETILVPADKGADPYAWAADCQKQAGGRKVCLLIPGRHFDSLGTRHGRGGGWYDRFLSAVPQDWIRIGISGVKDFSKVNLVRKAHDEPVDWVIVHDGYSWQIIKAGGGDKIVWFFIHFLLL